MIVKGHIIVQISIKKLVLIYLEENISEWWMRVQMEIIPVVSALINASSLAQDFFSSNQTINQPKPQEPDLQSVLGMLQQQQQQQHTH